MTNPYRVAFLLLIISIIGCSKTKPGWKTIEIGEYLIDVPDEFNLKPERGIDSQPGILKGRDFDLNYDYGTYCDTLLMTPKEYIKKGFWKDEAIMRYVSFRNHPGVDWAKTEVKAIRKSTAGDSSFAKGCDWVAACVYKKYTFNLPVFIPQEIKNNVVKIDTIQHHYRRMDYHFKGKKGITGIFIRDEKGSLDNGLQYPGLVIAAHNLTEAQQVLALQMFGSLRPKEDR